MNINRQLLLLIILHLYVHSNDIKPHKMIKGDYYPFFHINRVPAILSEFSKEFKIGIDITSQYNWLSPSDPNTYSIDLSQIINNNITIPFKDNSSINVLEIEELFLFKNEDKRTNIKLPLYLINDNKMRLLTGHDGVIAIPFSFKNKDHSLIHRYYQKGLIDHLSFAITGNEFNNHIYFGGIPIEEIHDKTKSHCDIIAQSILWDCRISMAKYTNQSTLIMHRSNGEEKEGIATFESASDYVYAPKDFVMKLFDHFIALRNGIRCSVEREGKMMQLCCNYHDRIFQGTMTFVIGMFSYEISMEDFWLCIEEFCLLSIVENKEDNQWRIGSSFYKKYHIEFNYDTARITFYSLTGVTPISHINTYIASITVFNICFLSLGSLMLILLIKPKVNKG